MSWEDVEHARWAFDAFNRRDMNALLEYLDPNIEWVPFRSALEGTVYWGHEGVRRNVAEAFEDWEWVRMEPEEFREAGDQVVALGRIVAKAKNGPVADAPVAWLVKLRDGKAIRFEVCLDRQQALKAAGLA